MIKKILIIVLFTSSIVNGQNYFVQHDLCHFHIQLPFFVKLIKDPYKNPGNPSYCGYNANIRGYGSISIGSNTIADDYFEGNAPEMYNSLVEYSNIIFDYNRGYVNNDAFVIYGDSEEGQSTYVFFIYSKAYQGSLRYDFPPSQATKIQKYIDVLEKTFQVD